MTTRILVPLDGSPRAEQALYPARELALATNGMLILVRSVLTRVFPGTDPTARQVRMVAEAEQYLDDVASRLTNEYIGVETAVTYGDPATMIIDEVRLRQPDFVVMATHGHAGVSRLLYGSVAEEVIAHCPIPVMLVQDCQRHDRTGLNDGLRIIVPLDGSAFAEEALPVAYALARSTGGSVTLVRAVPPLSYGPPYGYSLVVSPASDEVTDEMQQSRLQAAHAYLEGVAKQFPGTTIHVSEGRPETVITQVSERENAALVVMTTHGRTGLPRFVMGSVALATLRRGLAPVLLVRPARLQRAADEPSEAQATIDLNEDQIVLMRTGLRMLGQTIADDQPDLRARVRSLDDELSAAQQKAHSAVDTYDQTRRGA